MRLVLTALSFCLLTTAALAEPCRLALVLALDVSGSVDEEEYRQQLDGLAFALESEVVREAILLLGSTVEIAAFEWSSRNHQFLVLPWTALRTNDDISLAASRIRNYKKQRAGLKTALSTAMLFAAEMLRDRSDCWQRTVDVSGDGMNNIGPTMSNVYALDVFQGITVNALAVIKTAPDTENTTARESKTADLKVYFSKNVIRGPNSFALAARGYSDYAQAMQRKLLKEVAAPSFSQISVSPDMPTTN